jgi:hypothetical protein
MTEVQARVKDRDTDDDWPGVVDDCLPDEGPYVVADDRGDRA